MDDLGQRMAEGLINGTIRAGINRKWPFASMTIGQYAEVTEREEYNAALNAARAVERRKGYSFTRHFDRHTGRGVIVRTACLLLILWAGNAHAESHNGHCFANPWDCPEVAQYTGYQPELVHHDDSGAYPPINVQFPEQRHYDYVPLTPLDEAVSGQMPASVEHVEPDYLTPAETLSQCAYQHDCQGAFAR